MSVAKASGYFYGRKYKDVDFKSWIDVFVELGGGALFGWFASQWRMHRKHGKAIDSGLVGLLHHEVYMLCNHHIEVGYISTDDLDDLNYLFRSYKALGGNGTGEALYNKVLQLRIKN
ncbi:hypothetical protein [Lacticaseibacillus paracasei]|uniref:hypothetical protein n=1 Tax=Lacticaseibacillus paracasei TaxID=1597 RepID=UPI0021A3E1CF|nr:hypothetical protein [Lacticaseibacillus paracasei]